jgi:chromosome partitioning protein
LKIAIVSRKGGVGKTTTAVSLAAALARKGRRVLLVDLDAQGSASLSLGVEKGRWSPSMADVLFGGKPLKEVVRRTTEPGLDLVTAAPDLADADRALAQRGDRDRYLAQALESVAGLHDVTLLDCPAGLSLLTTAGLVASDTFLVPTMPQFLVVDGVANFLQRLERLRYRTGARARFLGLLLTQVDYRLRVTREIIDQLRQRWGEQVFGIEIRTNVRLAEAPSFGQTIFQYDEASTGAQAYTLLADELELRCRALRSGGVHGI